MDGVQQRAPPYAAYFASPGRRPRCRSNHRALSTEPATLRTQTAGIRGAQLLRMRCGAMGRVPDSFVPSLTRVDLSNTRLTIRGSEQLAALLKSCPLRELLLASTGIGDQTFLPMLPLLDGLELLDLSGNELTSRSSRIIASLLHKNECRLRELRFSWNEKLTSSGVVDLAASLNQNTSLVSLELCSVRAAEPHAAAAMRVAVALGDALSANKTLRHLDLGHNALDASACERLALGLAENHTLIGLHVAGNQARLGPTGHLVAEPKGWRPGQLGRRGRRWLLAGDGIRGECSTPFIRGLAVLPTSTRSEPSLSGAASARTGKPTLMRHAFAGAVRVSSRTGGAPDQRQWAHTHHCGSLDADAGRGEVEASSSECWLCSRWRIVRFVFTLHGKYGVGGGVGPAILSQGGEPGAPIPGWSRVWLVFPGPDPHRVQLRRSSPRVPEGGVAGGKHTRKNDNCKEILQLEGSACLPPGPVLFCLAFEATPERGSGIPHNSWAPAHAVTSDEHPIVLAELPRRHIANLVCLAGKKIDPVVLGAGAAGKKKERKPRGQPIQSDLDETTSVFLNRGIVEPGSAALTLSTLPRSLWPRVPEPEPEEEEEEEVIVPWALDRSVFAPRKLGEADSRAYFEAPDIGLVADFQRLVDKVSTVGKLLRRHFLRQLEENADGTDGRCGAKVRTARNDRSGTVSSILAQKAAAKAAAAREEALAACEAELKKAFAAEWGLLNLLFDVFAADNEGDAFSLTSFAYTALLDRCGVPDPGSRRVRPSDLDTIFIACNVEEGGANSTNEANLNIDRSLMRFEFCEAMMRIAIAKYIDDPLERRHLTRRRRSDGESIAAVAVQTQGTKVRSAPTVPSVAEALLLLFRDVRSALHLAPAPPAIFCSANASGDNDDMGGVFSLAAHGLSHDPATLHNVDAWRKRRLYTEAVDEVLRDPHWRPTPEGHAPFRAEVLALFHLYARTAERKFMSDAANAGAMKRANRRSSTASTGNNGPGVEATARRAYDGRHPKRARMSMFEWTSLVNDAALFSLATGTMAGFEDFGCDDADAGATFDYDDARVAFTRSTSKSSDELLRRWHWCCLGIVGFAEALARLAEVFPLPTDADLATAGATDAAGFYDALEEQTRRDVLLMESGDAGLSKMGDHPRIERPCMVAAESQALAPRLEKLLSMLALRVRKKWYAEPTMRSDNPLVLRFLHNELEKKGRSSHETHTD